MRRTMAMIGNMAAMAISRGTIREQEDHLLPEAKFVDVFHSETASNQGAPLELYQPIGLASVLVKQEQQQSNQSNQNKQTSSNKNADQFNHNQPKGPAAEALMLYLNGSRSHPFAMPFDRRVHPYDFKKGENPTFLYAADGSEQGVYMDSRFTRVMSLDNKSVADKQNKKTRYVSMAHVEKKMQEHKKQQQTQGQQGGQQQQSQQQEYKHEGESINTEVRLTKGRIEFRAGDTVVGYYDVQAKRWAFIGDVVRLGDDDAQHKVAGDTGSVMKTSPKVFVKATEDAHPASLDMQP